MSSAVAAVSPSSVDSGGPVITSFKSPLLERLLDGADPERRHVVLDLGAASEPLLERLRVSRPCRIEIADLVENAGLQILNGLEALEDNDDAASVRVLLPVANAEPLDLIFCWDLPNYLTLGALQRLMDVLAARAAPGCRLHMLVAYSRREMPASPPRYTPAGEGRLTQVCRSSAVKAAPRYSPEDLGIAVGRFRYERGVLLSNGMQEFVYAWPA